MAIRKIIKSIYYFWSKKRRVSIGKNTYVRKTAIIDPGKNGTIEIGQDCEIQDYAIIKCYNDGRIFIGDNVSINPFSILYGIGCLKIGNGVRIAAHTVIIPANHVYDERSIPIYKQGIKRIGIEINDNVWIGANVVILDGVKIGEHSVIAAGAVVNKDVPDHVVVAGVPCRTIKNL